MVEAPTALRPIQSLNFANQDRTLHCSTLFSLLTKIGTHSTVAQAKSHRVHNVLDPDYEPTSNDEDKSLFAKQQTFMYTVFNKVVQTDMGKRAVRANLHTPPGCCFP